MAVAAAAASAQESRTAVAAIDGGDVGGDVGAEAVRGCEGVGDGWRSRTIAKGRVRTMEGTGMHEYSFGHGVGGRFGPLVPSRSSPPSLPSCQY